MDDVRPELLISRLTSENESWRLDAETRLIALGESAVPPLIRSLQHAHPAVRLHAVHALARIRDPRGLKPVVRALGDSENNGAVAIASEKALVEWGVPAKKALIDEISDPTSPVRPRAIRTLSRIGGAELSSFLRPLLNDPNSTVRTQAAIGLTSVMGADSLPIVAALLQDGDKWVRYELAEALVKVGSDLGEKVLQQAKIDPEEQGGHIPFWAEELLDEIEELRRTGRAIAGSIPG